MMFKCVCCEGFQWKIVTKISRHAELTERTQKAQDRNRSRMLNPKVMQLPISSCMDHQSISSIPNTTAFLSVLWSAAGRCSNIMTVDTCTWTVVFLSNCGRKRPVLLTMDNTYFHRTLDLIECTRENHEGVHQILPTYFNLCQYQSFYGF